MSTLKERNTELFRVYQKNKDIKIRNKIVQNNLGIVKSIASKFNQRCRYNQKSSENYEDLFQIGVLGLIKAVEGFDVSQNTNFSTYAYPKVHSEIRHWLRDKGHLIRIPSTLQELHQKIKNYSIKNNISFLEASILLKIDYNRALESKNIFSINYVEIDEETLNSFLSFDCLELSINTFSLFQGLTELQKYVVYYRYLKDLTIKEISEIVKIKPQKLKTIEKQAFFVIKNNIKRS